MGEGFLSSNCSVAFIPAKQAAPPFDVRSALMCHRLPSERASESRAQSCVDKSQWDGWSDRVSQAGVK